MVVISHSLYRFIRHQLIYAASLPAPGEDARPLGEKRFQAFLDSVAQMMAKGADNDNEPPEADKPARLDPSARRPRAVLDFLMAFSRQGAAKPATCHLDSTALDSRSSSSIDTARYPRLRYPASRLTAIFASIGSFPST